MSDIVKEAQELLEGMPGAGWVMSEGRECYMHGASGKASVEEILFLCNAARVTKGLLERIQELEQERDVTLERVRVLEGGIARLRDLETDIWASDTADAWMDSDQRKSTVLNCGEAKQELYELLEEAKNA